MASPAALDRPVRWKRAACLFALAPLGWGLLAWARRDPELTERWYSQGVFPAVQRLQAWLQAWSPISVSELVIFFASLWLLIRLVRFGRQAAAGERSWRNGFARFTAGLFSAAGILGLVFQLVWGLNHARPTLAQLHGIEAGPVELSELVDLVDSLHRQAALERPDEDPWNGPAPEVDFESIRLAFEAVSRSSGYLEGPWVESRGAILSPVLTRLGITGIYSPFTGEAHVNREIPVVARYFTICHEIAHQRGIAREDEANFVAWLVCTHSTEHWVRYSGNLLALSYSLWAWYSVEPDAARDAFKSWDEDVRGDLMRLWSFWDTRRSTVTELARATNDLFLKGQGQAAGARSYGRMVDLLVAWRRRPSQ